MNKITKVEPVFVETIDEELEEGKLYISEKYQVAIHLCACGCKQKAVTPLGKDGWVLTKYNDKISLSPSIGNFKWEDPYHAHYFIIQNEVKFVK